MGIVIRKIGKKTVFSLFSLGVFVVAAAARLFFGGSHINLSQLESKTGDVLNTADKLISTARADSPSGSSGSAGGSEGDGCGAGSGGSGSAGGSSGGSDGGEGSGGGGEGS